MLVGARGSYELADEIASGGTATVHLGRLTGPAGFSRIVAIKRLHQHLAKNAEFRSMLTDEARLAARIHHPNVCSVLDVIANEGDLALVLDYVAGASLSALIKRLERPIPVPIAVAIATGVLAGLAAAHGATDDEERSLSLVHRDVSPQNVLIGVDGIARITDFGTAKALGRVTETGDGIIKGKVAYMAPEQIRDEAIDQRTDIYATAVVLWEMLADRRLFPGTGPATMLDVLEQTIPSPASLGAAIPSALDEAVMRGLSREREVRFSTAHEMAVALEEACAPATQRVVAEWVRSLVGDPSPPARAFSMPVEAHVERLESETRRTKGASPSAPAMRAVTPPPPSNLEQPSSANTKLASAIVAPDRTLGVPFSPELAEIIFHDKNGAAAVYGPLLIQVRWGDLTVEMVDRIEQISRFAFVRRTGPIGAIAIMEPGATIPGAKVRARQRVVFDSLLGSPRAPFMVYTILGREVASTLLRSVVRIYLRSNPRVHYADDLEAAAKWIAAQVERPARDARAFIDYVRALPRNPHKL